jgi:hypothetical protein
MFVTANVIDLAVNKQTISIQRIGFERSRIENSVA